MKTTVLALASILSAGTGIAAQDVGLNELTIAAPHHDQDMQMAVMFPTVGQHQTVIAENEIFYGTSVFKDAEPIQGQYPVVLLSHGWGGNYARMAWLSAGLVSRGAIVVAVNHPNTTTFDFDYASALDHWTRAEDMSAALDYVLQDPIFAPIIDETRIFATGLSYGGWTALSLAGVQGSRDGFFDYCKTAGAGSQFCNELTAEGVDITAIDQDRYEASYRDPRISGVAAIDPGLTWDLAPQDVQDVTVPLLLVGLGEGTHRLNATDTSAMGSNFEALVPQASVKTIAPATHFTALGLCKPAGEALLIEEQDDPVCTDPVGTDRTQVLNTIIDALADHFELN
ncbi:prolyl oligopeptidase family serine peptidase [Pseudovibrio sp. Ad37]|uniref:alpha/beta hydrolase family protein n=1 Tax=Pseudovibrio sp. Ad37 TaxID=989422 RepID=UPI0007AE6A93|nr:prolyl oligopeptidase family serine peptidase [Pseudovibrio sp. Ad37]KZL13686.1 Alpha/beta hydrolase family protein [Pseudovibrio sp. Ad37]